MITPTGRGKTPANELSQSALSWLFAGEWAPAADGSWRLHVPGAEVDGPGTASNLLNLALWSLSMSGAIILQKVRNPGTGGRGAGAERSATRIVRIREADGRRGLEGALLRCCRDEPAGLREALAGLELSDKAPWATVGGHCQAEAEDLGLVETAGRLAKRPVLVARDPEVEPLRARLDDSFQRRLVYRKLEADLDTATISDCAYAIRWAHRA